ncbi:MAG: YbaB/EbfC family nucleoid-associated protein [Actinomadura sp.]
MAGYGPDENLDPELMFRATREQFSQVEEMQRRMTGLEGRAESQDGRVSAVFTQAKGLADLRLDPRAMRTGSTELAEVIKEVAQEAKRDFERQAKALMDETFAQQDVTPDELKDMFSDPQGVTQTLGEMGKVFSGAAKEVEGILEQMRRTMGEGPRGPRP